MRLASAWKLWSGARRTRRRFAGRTASAEVSVFFEKDHKHVLPGVDHKNNIEIVQRLGPYSSSRLTKSEENKKARAAAKIYAHDLLSHKGYDFQLKFTNPPDPPQFHGTF